MASVYLTDVIGDGTTPATAFRPSVPAGTKYSALMVHTPSMVACIASPQDDVPGPGVMRLVTGASFEDLRSGSRNTNVPNNDPNGVDRQEINTWCTAHGLTSLPSGTISWHDAILFVCRQVNPSASLDLTFSS